MKKLALFLLAAIAAWSLSRVDTDTLPPSLHRLLFPIEIEADRVGPQNPAKNFPLQTQRGKSDYLLYNGTYPNAPILYLRIPYEFVGKASRPVHKYGTFFTVWYPEMTGSLNPANHERRECSGYCNGGILLLIRNEGLYLLGAAHVGWLGLQGDMQRLAKDPDFTYTKLEGHVPFEEVYEERLPNGKRELYYIRKSPEGAYLHFAHCWPDDPSPSCTAYMNSPTHRAIDIEYSFSMDHFEDWTAVQEAVARTVDSFVVDLFDPQR
jgi:hypothetical protein